MIVLKLASSTQLKLENEDLYLFEEQACGITVSSRADLKQTYGDYLITDRSLLSFRWRKCRPDPRIVIKQSPRFKFYNAKCLKGHTIVESLASSF